MLRIREPAILHFPSTERLQTPLSFPHEYMQMTQNTLWDLKKKGREGGKEEERSSLAESFAFHTNYREKCYIFGFTKYNLNS